VTAAHSRWLVCALLVLAFTVAGGFFRLHDAGRSLWLDELHTAWTVSDSIVEVVPRARMGHQSPLFFWLAWCSVRVTGLNEWGLRLPSLIAGIVLIPAAAAVAARWTGSAAAAAMAAGLVAADYYCIWYAQDARPYALLQLTALLHIAAFLELCGRPSWNLRLAFVAGGVLLFHLHYTAALLIASELAYYGLIATRRPSGLAYRPAALMCDLAIIAAGMGPALPWLWTTVTERGNWARFVPIPSLAAIVSVFPLSTYLVLPLLIGFLVEFVQRRRSSVDAQDWRVLWLLACWFLAPLLIAWCFTRFDIARIFYRRYLMISAIAPMILSAVLFARLSTIGRTMFVLAVVALSQTELGRRLLPDSLTPPPGPLTHYLQYGEFTSHASEEWRGAVRIVRSAADGVHLPVFVRSGLMETARLPRDRNEALRQYALLPVKSIYSPDRPEDRLSPLPPADQVQLTSEQLEQMIDHGGGWLLLRGNFGIEAVVADLLADLAARGVNAQLAGRWNLRRVTVLRIEVVK